MPDRPGHETDLHVTGDVATLVRAFPTWFLLSRFAGMQHTAVASGA